MSIYAFTSALSTGLLLGIVALGVYLDFCILRFPDLTIEGSFALGACVTIAGIQGGIHPLIATVIGALAGGTAGFVTGWMVSRLRVSPIVAGLLTMSASYSACLVALGAPNVAVDSVRTVFASLDRLQGRVGSMTISGMVIYPLVFLAGLAAVKTLLDRFLRSECGMEFRAAGSGSGLAVSQCIDPDVTIRRGLSLSNFLIGLCGALFAQKERFADVNMGFGMLVVGLASVFIGQALDRRASAKVAPATVAVICGSLAHRFSIALAYEVGLPTQYFNLFSAILVLGAVCFPNVRESIRTLAQRAIQHA